MSIRARLKTDLKKLNELRPKLPKEANDLLDGVGKQFATYEKRLRHFAKDVEGVSKTIQKTRKDIENKVQNLVDKETKKLNKRVNKFLNKLISASQPEAKPKKKRAARKKTAPKNAATA